MIRRAALLAVAGTLALPAVASAHPLGNFSINHLTQVRVAVNRIDVLYVLDQAEIPTFQERGLSAAEVIGRKEAEVARRLAVTVGGRRVRLNVAAPPRLSHPAGQGGLPTTRLELPLVARTPALGRVEVADGTFPGRVGWKAVVVRPGAGTAVRSSVPAADPTGGLRRYPKDLLRSPSDVRDARLQVARGAGTVSAPDARRIEVAGRGSGGFAGVLDHTREGAGVLALLLLAAFGWGALHALSPGHGKTMVAAYLVGTRGSRRDAVALGATVTVTHTAGVIALGLVALALSQWVLPDQLYPWLNLASGLLVVGVGARVLKARLKPDHAHRRHHHHHAHADGHDHTQGATDRRGLLAMGASAGLIPCPTALVVLLGAIAQHEIALGLVLIVAFSAGLATTLTALGVAVVSASRAFARVKAPGRAINAASAALIVVIGCVLTLQAVPQIVG